VSSTELYAFLSIFFSPSENGLLNIASCIGSAFVGFHVNQRRSNANDQVAGTSKRKATLEEEEDEEEPRGLEEVAPDRKGKKKSRDPISVSDNCWHDLYLAFASAVSKHDKHDR
jgi:hypothetical protein